MKIEFLKEKRAFLVGDYLVISDIHMGLEKTIEDKGYSIPSLRKNFTERIKKLSKETKSKKLIILGDVKHNVPVASWDEKYELPTFFRELSKYFKEIIIVKGNHDGNIEKMVHEEKVKIVRDFILKDVAFVHGHRYPTKEAMKCRTIIMGHIHPTFKIKDKSNTKHNYPCWVIGKFEKEKLKDRYKEIKCEKVIIVPSFNKLTSGYGDLSGPLAKAIKKEQVYLLDLTKVI